MGEVLKVVHLERVVEMTMTTIEEEVAVDAVHESISKGELTVGRRILEMR